MGIITALFVFGGLAQAIGIFVNVCIVLLFGIDSADAEAIGNIIGFVGGAVLANLVYVSIAGKEIQIVI